MTVSAEISVAVVRKRPVAEAIVELTLVPTLTSRLPEWAPGAHIDLLLPCGPTRQYSLCGDPADHERWTVAVLREQAGRGGSDYVHDRLLVGAELTVRGPRNHFSLVDAERYVLLAGGIGITPILPMVRQLAAGGADWQLHYGGRRRSSMAFCTELERVDGDRVQIYPQDEVGLIDLKCALGQPLAGTAVYCCGPPPLLDAVARHCGQQAPDVLHVEHFVPQAVDERATETGSFEVHLARSGLTLPVPPGVSILDVLEASGISVLSSCREGICGTCETAVLSGEVDHRDSLLTPAESAANNTMFICVSRARTPSLTIDR